MKILGVGTLAYDACASSRISATPVSYSVTTWPMILSRSSMISATFAFLVMREGVAWTPQTSRPFCDARCASQDRWGAAARCRITTPREQRRESSTQVSMIVDLFRGNPVSGSAPSLPRDVKEAVSSCRNAVQNALQQQVSRMVVEFPAGTKFGVEGIDKKVKSQLRQEVERSDRELARLFVEMFQPVGSENLAVIFTDDDFTTMARKKWEDDPTAGCKVLSINRKKSSASAKSKRSKGFAAKLTAEIEDNGSGPFRLPEKTEVAIFVAPSPKDVASIDRVCSQVGMGTLVILLNPRLTTSSGTEARTKEDFETVFLLAPAPLKESPGCILYRAYPNDWALGRKPKLGPPKTILTSPKRPTNEECQAAFNEADANVSNAERGLETTVESIASWFR